MSKPSSDTTAVGGCREPRQNSVFMFLPSGPGGLGGKGNKSSSRGGLGGRSSRSSSRVVFSVPGSSSTIQDGGEEGGGDDDNGQTAIISRRNKVIHIKNQCNQVGLVNKNQKRSNRNRPPIPPPPPTVLAVFRLPTKVESAGAGGSCSSLSNKDDKATLTPNSCYFSAATASTPTSPIMTRKMPRTDRDTKDSLGDSFKFITQHQEQQGTAGAGDAVGRPIGQEELQKYISWIRKNAPTLFWNGLKDRFAKLSQLDQNTMKGKQWIDLVHGAAANTATKFMERLQNRVNPLDFVVMEATATTRKKTSSVDSTGTTEDENEDAPAATSTPTTTKTKTVDKMKKKNIVIALDFLKRLMTGVLLSSDKQKILSDTELDEIFEKFYYFGLRSVIGHMNSVLNNTTESSFDSSASTTEEGATKSQNYHNKSYCPWCDEQPCNCQNVSNRFQNANGALHSMGLMDELAGPRLFSVIKKEMTAKITDVGTSTVDSSNLDELKEWLNESARAWYTALYMRDSMGRLLNHPPTEFGKELTTMLLEQYGMAIIKDLFPIIIEFPECKPLLDDLKTCMKAVSLRNVLVLNLKSSLERRLLNAGVNTSEVLEAYISTVRALKYVDPSGILVQLVTPPVREYLKHREETVRVILISLTEESGELSEELVRNPTNPDKTCKLTLQNYKLWKPDPIDVPKDKNNLRKSDLIEAMVSIYGSKTVFIDEYRALLADRLLRMPKPGSITREIKCLELLKLRFGEADLQKCEVMLKDVSDSQRLNTRFYEEEGAVLAKEAVQVSGLIVSAQFWPTFKKEDLTLPGPVQTALEKYTKAFEAIKGNRTLEWQKHIGTVKLEIEHAGTTVNFSVSPIQATIIYHFQEKEKWSLDELSKATGTSIAYLNNRIGFWISKGLILHIGQGVYALSDSIQSSSKATGVKIPNKYVEEIESDSPMTSTSSRRATELQVFWSYIQAMLTNLESLPLPRIHTMLKLFATVECNSDDLQRFLDDKVSHHLLVYSAGQYQLPK